MSYSSNNDNNNGNNNDNIGYKKRRVVVEEALDFMIHKYADSVPADCMELMKLVRDEGAISALVQRLSQHKNTTIPNIQLYAIVCSILGSSFAPLVESVHASWEEASARLASFPPSEYTFRSILSINK